MDAPQDFKLLGSPPSLVRETKWRNASWRLCAGIWAEFALDETRMLRVDGLRLTALLGTSANTGHLFRLAKDAGRGGFRCRMVRLVPETAGIGRSSDELGPAEFSRISGSP